MIAPNQLVRLRSLRSNSPQVAKPTELPRFGRDECERLANRYHADDAVVLAALAGYSPEQFLRLFLTSHGMPPAGIWQTHTYARITDSVTGKDHFFLIPIPYEPHERANVRGLPRPRPRIRFENGLLWVDEIPTAVRPQSIPHTTPFWYFHYNPNTEDRPYRSMTLNLKPECPERCVLCAGAKTGRVNNGMDDTLSPEAVMEKIVRQHPEAREQLDSIAIVTGCFQTFDALTTHLAEVRAAAEKVARPTTFRVLEHNVTTPEQFDVVVGKLGYDVFVTLECFDQELRNIALNGKVGRKGRDSRQFLELIRVYAEYLESHPELGKRLVRVTYLAGIDPLETTEYFFQQLAEINRGKQHAMVVPWMSVFTPYDKAMRVIQRPDFSLEFLIKAQQLAQKYFGADVCAAETGGTGHGYARGLF